MTVQEHDPAGEIARLKASQDGRIGLGRRLRALRQERSLTVSAAASLSGLSKGFISAVENGKTDASVGRLSQLVAAYGLSIMDILGQARPSLLLRPPGDISPSWVYESTEEGITYRVYADTPTRIACHVTIEPGSRWKDESTHPGTETGYLIEGSVDVRIGGRVFTVPEGHSYSIPPFVPHRFWNLQEITAQMFVLVESSD